MQTDPHAPGKGVRIRFSQAQLTHQWLFPVPMPFVPKADSKSHDISRRRSKYRHFVANRIFFQDYNNLCNILKIKGKLLELLTMSKVGTRTALSGPEEAQTSLY